MQTAAAAAAETALIRGGEGRGAALADGEPSLALSSIQYERQDLYLTLASAHAAVA